MNNNSFQKLSFLLLCVLLSISLLKGQEIPILNYATNAYGQVQLEVNSTANNYYILRIRHHEDSSFVVTTSMTLGTDSTTIIEETLGAYPIELLTVKIQ